MNDWRAWVIPVLFASPLLYLIYEAAVEAFRTSRSERAIVVGEVALCVGGDVAAKDSSLDFPVTVSFRCTVVDPQAAGEVRVGTLDAFLRRHVPLDAFDRTHAEGNERGLRAALTERLERSRSYDTAPGIRVVLSGVDVGRAYMEEA